MRWEFEYSEAMMAVTLAIRVEERLETAATGAVAVIVVEWIRAELSPEGREASSGTAGSLS